jgi:hypothetical protein
MFSNTNGTTVSYEDRYYRLRQEGFSESFSHREAARAVLLHAERTGTTPPPMPCPTCGHSATKQA